MTFSHLRNIPPIIPAVGKTFLATSKLAESLCYINITGKTDKLTTTTAFSNNVTCLVDV